MRFIFSGCLFLIVFILACERGRPTDHNAPDAVRDLLIDRIIWKPKAVPSRPGVFLNGHQFSISNTSRQHSYHQIQVRFDYYDSSYRLIGTKRWIVSSLIEPGTAVAIPPIQVYTPYLSARSATVRVEQALSD